MEKLISCFKENGELVVLNTGQKIGILAENPLEFLKKSGDIGRVILDGLEYSAASGFGKIFDRSSGDSVESQITVADSMAIIFDEHGIFGFASAQMFSGLNIFFLHGVVIKSEIKGKNLGFELVSSLFEKSGMARAAFTTQNPIMYAMLKKLCQKVYPTSIEKMVPASIGAIGDELIKIHLADLGIEAFDPETFVITGLYDECLYPEIPRHKDPAVNFWFETALEVKDGKTKNGFLFVGER